MNDEQVQSPPVNSPLAEDASSAEAEVQEATPTTPPASQENTWRRLWHRLKNSFLFRTRRRQIVTAVVGLPILCCLGYLLVGLIALPSTATLTDLKGIVQKKAEDATEWQTARNHDIVRNNDRVRTEELSGATLVFFDVSKVRLDEKTDVSVVEVSSRRGGSAVNVVLKTWAGRTWVRAVRFVDPGSTVRIDTPTASTVVRGARLAVEVAEDGSTRIDVEQGSATVTVGEQRVELAMGQRANVSAAAEVSTERLFTPDMRPLMDKGQAALDSPEKEFVLEIEEQELNQFLVAYVNENINFASDPQIWFLDDVGILGASVTEPFKAEVNIAFSLLVEDGQLRPRIRSVSAGGVPVPSQLADGLIHLVMGAYESYLADTYQWLEFTTVQIEEGRAVVRANKLYR
ncbi:MAG: FecR domain-containing protein [Anaerolineae bacterium]|nr:FecR domain-containing protein [Anaerolineae bacterium]